jgi:hypothetical protein
MCSVDKEKCNKKVDCQIEHVNMNLGSIANKKIYKNWHVLVAEFAEQSTYDPKFEGSIAPAFQG